MTYGQGRAEKIATKRHRPRVVGSDLTTALRRKSPGQCPSVRPREWRWCDSLGTPQSMQDISSSAEDLGVCEPENEEDWDVNGCSSAGSEVGLRRKTLAMMKLLSGVHCFFLRRSQSLLMLLIVTGLT